MFSNPEWSDLRIIIEVVDFVFLDLSPVITGNECDSGANIGYAIGGFGVLNFAPNTEMMPSTTDNVKAPQTVMIYVSMETREGTSSGSKET